MKVNQWTLGLAAAGVISFGAVAQAEEKPSNQVLTAVSGTQISGYVSTSVHWNPGQSTGFAAGAGSSYLAGKGDGFNLDVIQLTLSKPLDEGEWSAGYVAELWMGPDAGVLGNTLAGAAGTAGNISLAQGYLALNVPVGNGITVKVGTFNTIVGYEGNNSPDNPNYSRSYAYTVGPFQHEGILASYKVCDGFNVQAGVANAQNTGLGLRGANAVQSQKTYMAGVSLTAPDSWGFLKGAVLNAAVVDGQTSAAAGVARDFQNIHVGATVPTPWESIKTGAALDIIRRDQAADTTSIALYTSFNNVGIEKLKLNTRVEYFDNGSAALAALGGAASAGRGRANVAGVGAAEVLAATITADYQLWKNVISRLEYRWDHDASGGKHLPGNVNSGGLGGAGNNNAHLVALNLIYKF
jgi:Putative beta-barrel porin-2, OmpL-like. bbp2